LHERIQILILLPQTIYRSSSVSLWQIARVVSGQEEQSQCLDDYPLLLFRTYERIRILPVYICVCINESSSPQSYKQSKYLESILGIREDLNLAHYFCALDYPNWFSVFSLRTLVVSSSSIILLFVCLGLWAQKSNLCLILIKKKPWVRIDSLLYFFGNLEILSSRIFSLYSTNFTMAPWTS